MVSTKNPLGNFYWQNIAILFCIADEKEKNEKNFAFVRFPMKNRKFKRRWWKKSFISGEPYFFWKMLINLMGEFFIINFLKIYFGFQVIVLNLWLLFYCQIILQIKLIIKNSRFKFLIKFHQPREIHFNFMHNFKHFSTVFIA